jgi:hypothetical protein
MTTLTRDSAAGPHTVTNHPAATLGMPARIAAAMTLVLGFALHTASVVILALPHNSDPVAWMTWVAENPGRAQISKTLDVLFVPFMVGGVVVYVLLGRLRSRRLAWVGGVLFAGGLIGLASHEGYEAFAYTLVTGGTLDAQATGAVLLESSPADAAAQILFLLGLMIGLPLTVASLWRSGVVPRPAALLLLLFLIVDLAGYRVESHLLGLAGATWIAVVVLRAPRAEAARG